MRTPHFLTAACFILMLAWLETLFPQSSTGSISGSVTDQNNAAISGAIVTAKNISTGFARSTTTDSKGSYILADIPRGNYEVTFDAASFPKYVRSGLTLDVSQNAVVDALLEPQDIAEVVTVNENASILNTATAEISTRFDARRLSELPIGSNRSVLNVLLSVPGVSQLGVGQTSYASGISFSANGGRIRSNNFTLDGQDINDAVFTGTGFALNNPDAIQEVRIVTNQFKAENGRNSGSIVNFVGKSGTNDYHGSLFWFHNNEYLNACSNLDKVASFAPTGYCNPNAVTDDRKRAPKRREDQIGFTFGGPLTLPGFGDGGDSGIWKGTDKTFFFGDFQRWTDRSQRSGFTLIGAPTASGRAVLQPLAVTRPQVQALLDFVPAGTPDPSNPRFATFSIQQQLYQVELGTLTGSSSFAFTDSQGSVRIDHRVNSKNLIYGRYRSDSQRTSGDGQVTPPGHTLVRSISSTAAMIVLNSYLTNHFFNEAHIALARFRSSGDAEDPRSKTIPAIAIPGLGMVNSLQNRTAFGLPPNLPGAREIHTYQITDALTYFSAGHIVKFGIELRRTGATISAFQNARGRLQYISPTPGDITNFINDKASRADINFPLPGGEEVGHYRWHELYAFGQDEWRVAKGFTLTFGVRYEYPGDSFSYLKEVNDRILAANGNNPALKIGRLPKADVNNFMPRLGFNWNPRTSGRGIIGFVTGKDKLVFRGGYSRTFDANFININANEFYSFPFVWTENVSTAGAFAAIRHASPHIINPNRVPRTVVSQDLRAPAADQFSFDIQRELSKDVLLQVGYIKTRGTGLLQIVDGNPCRLGYDCRVAFGNRVDPDLEVVQLYTNAASSTYDALQTSVIRRLSDNFGAGLHYTWSSFIDDVSDIFSPSATEIPVSQEPFNRRGDRARSSYDRPHRLTGNFVYELPFYSPQKGFAGRVLGGWQVNSFFTFQSGAPFTVSAGSDPGCAVCGIADTVRANLNTKLDLSSMSITEILAAGGRDLFSAPSAAQRVGNAGRNILRSDSFRNVDIGIIKNTRLTEDARIQFWFDMFNAFNWRNFGIPSGAFNSSAFLNKWVTDGGSRRIRLGARIVF